MTQGDASSLDPAALDLRLRQRIGDERNGQVDFLLDLEVFDRREDFLRAGFGSLWDYLRRSLHLREGATHRRITAMRLLRRFPALEAPLRDGRLCLTTVAILRDVLTGESLDEVVAKAAFLSRAETEHLVATLRPRGAPREGIRRLPEQAVRIEAPPVPAPGGGEAEPLAPALSPMRRERGSDVPPLTPAPIRGGNEAADRPASLEAVSADRWSLRVTIDGALKEDLETLRALASHKLPGADLVSLLREAVRCGIEKHGKRRGAVVPERARKAGRPAAPGRSKAIPAEVRRRVWERDGGRCTFTAPDGRRCGSRHQLELHHVVPEARGGRSTEANLTLHCRAHNLLEAEAAYGPEHMARFRRLRLGTPRAGESTSSRRGAEWPTCGRRDPGLRSPTPAGTGRRPPG
jgi:5-methylcytosine-specific restriction endonuclease McrA